MIVCYTVRNWSFCDGPFSKYEKASSRLDIHDTEQGEEKDKQVSVCILGGLVARIFYGVHHVHYV